MEHSITHRIYSIFALVHYVKITFESFPYDCIKIIIMNMAPKISINCGDSHIILLIDSDAYAWGKNNP